MTPTLNKLFAAVLLKDDYNVDYGNVKGTSFRFEHQGLNFLVTSGSDDKSFVLIYALTDFEYTPGDNLSGYCDKGNTMKTINNFVKRELNKY